MLRRIRLKYYMDYNFYVPKALNAFLLKQRFCTRRAQFLKKFSTQYFQIFYVYSKHGYLWNNEAVLNIFNFLIVKLTKKSKKVDFCLNYRYFVILQNKKNPLRHFRAMVIVIMKIFDLFVSDDVDCGYRARHGHAFFLRHFLHC